MKEHPKTAYVVITWPGHHHAPKPKSESLRDIEQAIRTTISQRDSDFVSVHVPFGGMTSNSEEIHLAVNTDQPRSNRLYLRNDTVLYMPEKCVPSDECDLRARYTMRVDDGAHLLTRGSAIIAAFWERQTANKWKQDFDKRSLYQYEYGRCRLGDGKLHAFLGKGLAEDRTDPIEIRFSYGCFTVAFAFTSGSPLVRRLHPLGCITEIEATIVAPNMPHLDKIPCTLRFGDELNGLIEVHTKQDAMT